jgi:hypothetical protein
MVASSKHVFASDYHCFSQRCQFPFCPGNDNQDLKFAVLINNLDPTIKKQGAYKNIAN